MNGHYEMRDRLALTHREATSKRGGSAWSVRMNGEPASVIEGQAIALNAGS